MTFHACNYRALRILTATLTILDDHFSSSAYPYHCPSGHHYFLGKCTAPMMLSPSITN